MLVSYGASELPSTYKRPSLYLEICVTSTELLTVTK